MNHSLKSSPLYLAVDGGGTHTRARLTDVSGAVIGEGRSGSSNLTLGIDVSSQAVAAAADEALRVAGLGESARSCIHAGFGLAGANVPELAQAIRACPFGYASIAVVSDAQAACLGAHAGQDGAILILGTGSQGFAMVGDSGTAVGGWGFALSDDASGAILGREAIRAALRAAEAFAPASALTTEIMTRFNDNPSQAVLWSQTATPRDYGHFAPLVFQYAGRDEVADALLASAVAFIVAMLDRLLALGAPRITLVGGLAAPYRPLLPKLYDPVLVKAQGDAMDGALMLARNAASAGR